MATERRARTKRLRAGLTGLYYNVKALEIFALFNKKYKKSISLVLLYTSLKNSLVQYIKEIYIYIFVTFFFSRLQNTLPVIDPLCYKELP